MRVKYFTKLLNSKCSGTYSYIRKIKGPKILKLMFGKKSW